MKFCMTRPFFKLIFDIIESKTGKAEILAGNRNELDNWLQVKTALQQCYFDRGDLNCLVQELTRAGPLISELV